MIKIFSYKCLFMLIVLNYCSLSVSDIKDVSDKGIVIKIFDKELRLYGDYILYSESYLTDASGKGLPATFLIKKEKVYLNNEAFYGRGIVYFGDYINLKLHNEFEESSFEIAQRVSGKKIIDKIEFFEHEIKGLKVKEKIIYLYNNISISKVLIHDENKFISIEDYNKGMWKKFIDFID